MSNSTTIDLSFAPGEQQDLADLPYEVEMLDGQAAEDVQELNISHAHVLLLTSTPEAPINDILQFVTVLRASHNEISGLRGLEAFVSLEVLDLSYNCLRVVDAHAANLLKTLKRLRTVDFSHNHMSLLDLDGSYGAPSPRSTGANGAAAASSSSGIFAGAGGSGGAAGATNGGYAGRHPSSSSGNLADGVNGLASLTAINLSHNAFIEMPDLRSAPFLQVLNMSHNKLDAIADLDVRLPLLSLHSLLLHANHLPNATALVPLCALATTLKHLQVFNNPFTLVNGSLAEGIDEAQWWRPFLLFLCPLLSTVDQTEFTTSERRVALKRLFREHGALSRSAMEHMNPQNKDALEAYLKRQSAAAEPPADALVVIKELEEEEAREAELPSKGFDGHNGRDGAAAHKHAKEADADDAQEVEEEEEEAYTTDVVVPMSRMNTVREQGSAASWGEGSGARTKGSALTYFTEPGEGSSSLAGGAGNANSSSRGSTRVVIVEPTSKQQQQKTVQRASSASPTDGILVTNHNRQRTKTVPIATVVRALQQKTRTLEEVVAVLWRSDLARRTAAALTIQRYMRGALARMRLSEDDAESCRFIRYQLQQASAAAKEAQRAAHASAGVAGPASVSRGPSARAAAVHGARQPSIEAIEASGSNMEEVLVSMRSLQEVMSSMWVDLEEYRAMADREQRRAAVLIQRWYRGYRARRAFGRVQRQRGSWASSTRATVSPTCKCAAKTAALQKEVTELRHEMRELRELLAQSTRQQRLAAYDDPERAMDEIVRKHEARVGADRARERQFVVDDDSRSPSATPSITAADLGAVSQERGFLRSSPRGDSHVTRGSRGDAVESTAKSPSQPKAYVHRMPQELSARISPQGGSSPAHTSPGSQAKRPAKITKRRPGDASSSSHPVSPYSSSAVDMD